MKRIHKVSFGFGVIMGAVISSLTVFGSGFSLPHPAFVSGEVISAQKINENFQAIVNHLNSVSSIPVATNINSYQEINLSSADNGQFFVVHASVKMNLPPISAVDPGFKLRFSQPLGGQAVIAPAAGDLYSGSDHLMVLENNTQSSAYIELISTGSEWIHTISTNGNFTRVDPNKIFIGSCSGNGSGSANCYENTTAKDTTNFGFVFANNYLHTFDGSSWRKMGQNYNFEYLIYDSSSLMPAFSYTKNYSLGQTGPSQMGGVIYFHNTSYGSTSISSVLAGMTSLMNHTGSNLDNDLNIKIENNFLNPNLANYGYGSHCQNQLGKDWKMITNTQASLISGATEFWTASSGPNPNEYIYIDNTETAVATSDLNAVYKSFLCVYLP